MSEPGEPDVVVPSGLESGVFAHVVRVFDDVDYVTIDLVRLDPRDVSIGFVVARVTASISCILSLKQRIEHIT